MPEYEVHGDKIFYQTYGGGGKRLLLVHDIGFSGTYFERLISNFAARAYIVVPDLCGHGQSYLPQKTVSLKTVARELVNLLRDEYIGKVDVIACGTGGAVVLEGFAMAPELFGDILLLNTALYPQAGQGMVQQIRPESQQRYAEFRNTFKRWVPAYRDDFFIFCREFNGRQICRFCGTRIRFIYGDRANPGAFTRQSLGLPEFSNISLRLISGAGRWLLEDNYTEVCNEIERFLFLGGQGDDVEDNQNNGNDPDISDLMFFH